MTVDLPVGTQPRALEFPHFPTRFQAVVWRNWELVAPATLARVLRTDEATVLGLAADLGLRVPPQVNPRWLERGYVTLIRANWHLLPYEQLLDLLGWPRERLAYALKEEDFLWHKLGDLKPLVEPALYRDLTPSERERTRRIRELVARRFPTLHAPETARPFDFLDAFAAPPPEADRAASGKAASSAFELRFLYAYSAVYGDPLSDPALDPYPDGLLARLQALGINAVWLPVILYTLFPWKFGRYSAGYERRLEALRRLTERAARYGISVLVYLNEPRCMPLAFFDEHPGLQGNALQGIDAHNGVLCTSVPEVQELLRDGAAWLFQQVPLLGGAFTITMSENPTNCYSRFAGCPRCAQRKPAEVVAEINRLIAEGVHSVKPEAPVIAWDWGWPPEWAHEAVDLLPDDVWFMCTSEWGLDTCVGGVAGKVKDYTISQPGPSQRALALWERARRRGLRTAAKVQVNNTWECSAVPYLPVPDLVEEHLDRLRQAGVGGLMLSWTLGGYPGGNLPLLHDRVDEMAARLFGPAAAEVRAAWRTFSTAFREFPFNPGVAYFAPQNVGPKNLLYGEPTGYRATMVGDPYDEIAGWHWIYPEEVLEAQFRKVSEGWKTGLDELRAVAPPRERAWCTAFDDLQRIATAAYCHFRSAYLQIAFVRLRDRGDAASRARMLEILDEEMQLAATLHEGVSQDSRIGFEATNHYAYTRQDLREKVIACQFLRDRLTGAAGT